LVTVNVAVPQNMNDEQRDALQTYADLVAGEDPRKDLNALAGNSNG
jgi:DnaJ-class molecular chaperone